MSGIIPTPAQAQRISAMPVINDLTQRKSIRIPVSTPEQGLEAIELKDVLEPLVSKDLLQDVIDKLINTLMPTGYIHIQYTDTDDPTLLYPTMQWADITSSYDEYYFMPDIRSVGKTLIAGLPNLSGYALSMTQDYEHSAARSGAFSEYKLNGGWVSWYSGNKDYMKFNSHTLSFDASKYNSIYGDVSTVRPRTKTIKIWRKVGTLTGVKKSFAMLDEYDIYMKTVELEQDEAGFIGLTEATMIESLPLDTPKEGYAIVYNRESQQWSQVVDHRRKTAYKKNSYDSRIIQVVGDDLAEDETWEERIYEPEQFSVGPAPRPEQQ